MRLTYPVTKTTWRILKLVTVAVLVTGAVLWFVLSPISVHFHVVARGQIATEVMGTETREFTVDVQTLELPKNWAIGHPRFLRKMAPRQVSADVNNACRGG